MDKYARLQIFFKRLQEAPTASTHDDAFTLLSDTLNAVEDEHSGVICNPDNWENDARLYPPKSDSARRVDDFPGLIRYRSLSHNTYIGQNGAIEIRTIATDQVDFKKSGTDGKGVWDE